MKNKYSGQRFASRHLQSSAYLAVLSSVNCTGYTQGLYRHSMEDHVHETPPVSPTG